MTDPIYNKLRPVRRRLRLGRALNAALRALAVTAVLAIALEAMRRGFGWWAPSWPAVAVLVSGPVLGALLGLLRRPRWMDAAAAVDDRFRLKDRAGSALDLGGRSEGSPLHGLVVEDAASHLSGLETHRAAPLRPFRGWWGAAALAVLAVTLAFWPGAARHGAAAPSEPLVPIVEQAEDVEKQIEELEQLAEKQDEQELRELAREMKKQAEAMKKPGNHVEEALKRLSKMQMAVQQQQAKYNLAVVDRQLESLAGAMAGIEPMSDVARALKQGKHKRAAKKLEQKKNPELNRKQRQQLRRNLKDAAKKMKQAGLKGLGQATGQLAEAAGGQGGGKGMGEAGKAMAKQLRRHARRKRINQWMDRQLARLTERKSRSLSFSFCSACNGTGCSSCNGTGLKPGSGGSRSNTPSQQAGKGSSGNPKQEPTRLDSNRNRERLTGKKGRGPSQKQVTRSTGGRQQAGRSYRESYQEYRKRSEAVLENEAIPLGHRQSIRRYFELIRPQGAGEASGAE